MLSHVSYDLPCYAVCNLVSLCYKGVDLICVTVQLLCNTEYGLQCVISPRAAFTNMD